MAYSVRGSSFAQDAPRGGSDGLPSLCRDQESPARNDCSTKLILIIFAVCVCVLVCA